MASFSPISGRPDIPLNQIRVQSRSRVVTPAALPRTVKSAGATQTYRIPGMDPEVARCLSNGRICNQRALLCLRRGNDRSRPYAERQKYGQLARAFAERGKVYTNQARALMAKGSAPARDVNHQLNALINAKNGTALIDFIHGLMRATDPGSKSLYQAIKGGKYPAVFQVIADSINERKRGNVGPKMDPKYIERIIKRDGILGLIQT